MGRAIKGTHGLVGPGKELSRSKWRHPAEIRAQVAGGGVRVHRAMQSLTPDLALTHSPILPMAAFPAPKWPHEHQHQQAFPWPPPWHLCLSVLSGGFISACCPLLTHWIPQFKSQILHFLAL